MTQSGTLHLADRDVTPSGLTLAVLSALWVALLGGALVLAHDGWTAALAPPPVVPAAGVLPALVAGLGKALAAVAPFAAVFYAALLGGPPFLLAWLALPRADRRSFPAVLAAWALASAAALAGWLPAAGPLGAAAACVPALLAAEVLRAVLTAGVRRVTSEPDATRVGV